MIANLIVVLFQIQLPGTIDGWILNNSGSINPLTSGRLGGFQGGGPNVIGIICAIYALVCLFKISSSKNLFSYLMSDTLNTTLLIISLFNLYITFSRGSYIALFIGSLVLLFYTYLFTNNSKILIIAGSDSSGGAGIQADIKTVTALGSYAMTAITAITAQNTTGVKSIVPISTKEIFNQITFTIKDIKPDAIKIGMLHSNKVIESVIQSLKIANIKNIVLDPVMVAKGGTKLIDDKAIKILKLKLIKMIKAQG